MGRTIGDKVIAKAIEMRGYVVVGFKPESNYMKSRDWVYDFARMSIARPLKLKKKTTKTDWLSQASALKPIFGKNKLIPRPTDSGVPKGATFFRAMPEAVI